MDGSRLLDANLLIAYLENERAVVERALEADAVYVSVVALGELHFGARKSKRLNQNLNRIASFLQWAKIAVCDEQTAELYGVIKEQLRAKGKMIPDNDIWIAATSRQLDVTLASRDQHFAHIDQLSWEIW
jgi:tRNA(fMet)-specific endonuclease VapC